VSKDDLIQDLSVKNAALAHENALLRQALYGKKTERFIAEPVADNQSSLFEDSESEPANPEEIEQITYERKKRKPHPGRNPLPDHLPQRVVIIEPDEDTTDMVRIGEEITITLEYTPASLVKVITKRQKYIRPDNNGIAIGDLPSRPIEKGIPEASLLAHIIVAKFIDHLPFYRQIQRFKRDYEWDLPSSTINDWFIACCTLLEPLYEEMKRQLLDTDYLQADESPIKVQDKKKKGSTHQGYQWVYRNPENDIVIFQYRKGRGMQGPKEMLANFEGYLQSDGYKVYDKIGKRAEITQLGCWAHARRKFFESKNNDKPLAEFALSLIQAIYAHNKKAKELDSPQEIKAYRDEHLKPLTARIHQWASEQQSKVLPKSPIGKAITYLLLQWPKLIAILQDGRLEIDNNLIENKIRPLALGRKNYLFAGSHDAAQRIAMIYSFFGTCKAKGINPFVWLEETLRKLPDTKLGDLGELVPGSEQV